MKELKDMTNKELLNQLNDIENHISNLGYGRFELNYREEIYREIDKRKLDIQENKSFSIVN